MGSRKVGVMAMFSIEEENIVQWMELNGKAEITLLNQGVKLPLIPCTRASKYVMEDVETCDRSMNLVLRSSTKYLAI